MTDQFDKPLSTIPNDRYQKFFAKFAEIDILPIEQWKAAHLLAYFCRKYKQAYNIDYAWKFNNPAPSKCFEVWQINVLSSKLSAKPRILKDYIDWSFQILVPKAKRRLTSISFLTKDEVVNPYKMEVLLGNNKDHGMDRSTPLPDKYRQMLDASITDYGSLAFACQVDPMPQGLSEALIKMQEMGFDLDILKRIV